METLNEFATLIGFGTFKGMMMYFGFLTLILLIGFGTRNYQLKIKQQWNNKI